MLAWRVLLKLHLNGESDCQRDEGKVYEKNYRHIKTVYYFGNFMHKPNIFVILVFLSVFSLLPKTTKFKNHKFL